jgi:uncharacterized membrane protein
MMAEYFLSNWPIFILSVITVAVLLQAFSTRNKVQNNKIYRNAIILLIIGLLGLYFGIYQVISTGEVYKEVTGIEPNHSDSVFMEGAFIIFGIFVIIIGYVVLAKSKMTGSKLSQ